MCVASVVNIDGIQLKNELIYTLTAVLVSLVGFSLFDFEEGVTLNIIKLQA